MSGPHDDNSTGPRGSRVKFSRDWQRLGLDDADLRFLEVMILENPTRSPVIQGYGRVLCARNASVKAAVMGEASKNNNKTKGRVKRPRGRRVSGVKPLSPAGSRIVSAFQEAIDVMRSGESLPERLTVRSCQTVFVSPSYGPEDVRRVRDLLGMSRVVFARFLGVDPNTVRSWEQGTRPPSSIARRFMGEIEVNPAYWLERVAVKSVC